MPSAMLEALLGFTRTAAPPDTSSVELPKLVTTGTPCDIASKMGNPNPSRSDG